MPEPEKLIFRPAHFISMGFGSGLMPFAPGTFGTLVAIPLYLLLRELPWWQYGLIVLIFLLLGIWLCHSTAKALGVHDHQSIVWDEVVGYLITMFAAPRHWLWIVIGFGLFRLFDIVKPWPIKWLDRHVHGGLGIMLDDVAAGVAAALVLQSMHFSGVMAWLTTN